MFPIIRNDLLPDEWVQSGVENLPPPPVGTDHTASLKMKMTEKVALYLSDMLDADNFECALNKGELTFSRAFLRIVRRIKTPQAASPGGSSELPEQETKIFVDTKDC